MSIATYVHKIFRHRARPAATRAPQRERSFQMNFDKRKKTKATDKLVISDVRRCSNVFVKQILEKESFHLLAVLLYHLVSSVANLLHFKHNHPRGNF